MHGKTALDAWATTAADTSATMVAVSWCITSKRCWIWLTSECAIKQISPTMRCWRMWVDACGILWLEPSLLPRDLVSGFRSGLLELSSNLHLLSGKKRLGLANCIMTAPRCWLTGAREDIATPLHVNLPHCEMYPLKDKFTWLASESSECMDISDPAIFWITCWCLQSFDCRFLFAELSWTWYWATALLTADLNINITAFRCIGLCSLKGSRWYSDAIRLCSCWVCLLWELFWL